MEATATTKTKTNKMIGISATTVCMIAFLFKGMQGQSAGWEAMLPLVAAGLVLTAITVIRKRNAWAWVSLGACGLALIAFFLG